LQLSDLSRRRVAGFDCREVGEAFRSVTMPGIVVAFWDIRRDLTGETPYIQRPDFRRRNCTR
jgi:hypothetical protein